MISRSLSYVVAPLSYSLSLCPCVYVTSLFCLFALSLSLSLSLSVCVSISYVCSPSRINKVSAVSIACEMGVSPRICVIGGIKRVTIVALNCRGISTRISTRVIPSVPNCTRPNLEPEIPLPNSVISEEAKPYLLRCVCVCVVVFCCVLKLCCVGG